MLQTELLQDAIVYYFQNCLSTLCYDIFGMIVVLTNFVRGCFTLCENQQTLSTVQVFPSVDHIVVQYGISGF